jgi:beta-lactamase class D
MKPLLRRGLFLCAMRILIPFIATAFVACSSPPEETVVVVQPPTHELRDDLRAPYDSARVNGSFILHDRGKDHWIFIDSVQADVATLPASTYKVFSSLIALEDGVVKDADEVRPWDHVRRRPEIDRDLNLRDAMRHSAYWFHRDVARQIGADRLKHWWDTVGYGNADTTAGFDKAWVAGNLRITPRQQVRFLERLYDNDLPFSQRTMDIVKEIMVNEDTLGYTLRGKTGWATPPGQDIGWFIGWVERADSTGPFFFANRVICTDTTNDRFMNARRGTAIQQLRNLRVLP